LKNIVKSMKVPLYHDSHFNMQYIYGRTMNMNELLHNHVIHRQYRDAKHCVTNLYFLYLRSNLLILYPQRWIL